MAAGEQVRAVLRDRGKAALWAARGCEVAAAGMTDAAGLGRAFGGAEGVFVLLPPVFDPSPKFMEARGDRHRAGGAGRGAAGARGLPVHRGGGGDGAEPAPAVGDDGGALGTLGLPVAFLRAAWFMENAASDISAARAGRIESCLQPLARTLSKRINAALMSCAATLRSELLAGLALAGQCAAGARS